MDKITDINEVIVNQNDELLVHKLIFAEAF